MDSALLGLGSALVVAAATSVTTVQLARLANRAKEREKAQDWARQDEVAARAEQAAADLAASQARIAEQAQQAARLLLDAQRETKEAAEEVARLAAIAAEHQDAKLREISEATDRVHDLVNSDMTAARREALEQTKLTLAALRKLVAVDQNASPPQEPDPRDLEAIREAEARIAELEDILADRLNQLRLVEAKERQRDSP